MIGSALAPRTVPGQELLETVLPMLEPLRATAARRDREATFPHEDFDRFAAAGVLGATVPPEHGGRGVTDLFDVAVVLAAVAAADPGAALALHMQLSRGITVTYDWRSTNSVVWAELLSSMATGRALVCGAVAERGRDYEHVSTSVSGGRQLTGHKTFVTLSTAATHFVVRARTAAEPGRYCVVLMERDTAGLHVADPPDLLGMRSSGSADVTFAACPVDERQLWVREPWGLVSTASLIGRAVSSTAMLGIYLGIAERAVELTRQAVGRHAGAGVSSGAGALLADLEVRLHSLRAVTAHTVSSVASGASAGADPTAVMRIFQAGKLFVNEQSRLVVDTSMSLTGGAAFGAQHELARLYRDVRAGSFMQPYSPPDAVTFLADTAFSAPG